MGLIEGRGYLQDLQGNASSYGHDDMLFSEVLLELLDHHGDVLRLYGDENDVGVLDNLQTSKALRLRERAGRAVSDCRLASELESEALAPKSLKTFLRSWLISVAQMLLASTFFFAMNP